MLQRTPAPYLTVTLILVSLLLFQGCGGSGGQSERYWSDYGNARVPQITGIVNLNSSGQPVRIGDWCQISGTYFGSDKGNGYVSFTFQDSTDGKADIIYQWSDSQIICRVPSANKSGMHVKAAVPAVSLTVFTNEGTGSNAFSTGYDPSPNPTPQPTPPSPSPSPTPSATPTPSPTSTVSPSPSPTPSVTPTPSPTATISPSPTPTATWWDMGAADGGEQQCPNLVFSSTGTAYVSYDDYDVNLGTWLVCFGSYDSSGYHKLASIDVGTEGGFSSLALNENNVPYLAYCMDGDVYVAKYKDGAFTTIGSASCGEAPSLYVSGTYAYLAYEYADEENTYVTAGYFNDQGVWKGFIDGGFNGMFPKIAGVGNTVYMAFVDCDSLVAGYFPDGNWTILGDFDSPLYCLGVSVDKGQDFYVSYLRYTGASKKGGKSDFVSTLNVYAYKNGAWSGYPPIETSWIISFPYFSGAPAVKNGQVFTAFSELDSPDPTSCRYQARRFLGSSWQNVGDPSFNPPENPNCFITPAFGGGGIPYVFCTGPDSNMHLYKYDVLK